MSGLGKRLEFKKTVSPWQHTTVRASSFQAGAMSAQSAHHGVKNLTKTQPGLASRYLSAAGSAMTKP